MSTERGDRPDDWSSLHGLFSPVPLPRWRAAASLILAAAGVLSIGGLLEYATGSPAAQAAEGRLYWVLFFAFNAAAFGGAALFGGLPPLARRPVKAGWTAVVAGLYAAAFASWYRHQPEPALADWLARSSACAPAAVALLAGLAFSSRIRRVST